jgi:hypothetical protein
MRSAVWAGYRLGVKTTVKWIVIFGGASRTHLESPHRGFGTVVGDILDDREARAAVRAVNEGIAITLVARIKQFLQAVWADADIGGYGYEIAGFTFRVDDLKSRESVGGDPVYLE